MQHTNNLIYTLVLFLCMLHCEIKVTYLLVQSTSADSCCAKVICYKIVNLPVAFHKNTEPIQ